MLGSLLGGIASGVAGLMGADKQADLQKQFAKNAIQWKVNDAKKAGVHPLYALGANTVSYSPVSTGDFGFLADMGQNIDRARMASSDNSARVGAGALNRLTLERAGLENDLLRAEIAKTRAQVPPPMPSVSSVPGLIPEEMKPPQKVTGLNVGTGIRANPYFSDAETIENRYGDNELLSMATTVINGLADAYWNFPSAKASAAYRTYLPRYARAISPRTYIPRSGGSGW